MLAALLCAVVGATMVVTTVYVAPVPPLAALSLFTAALIGSLGVMLLVLRVVAEPLR